MGSYPSADGRRFKSPQLAVTTKILLIESLIAFFHLTRIARMNTNWRSGVIEIQKYDNDYKYFIGV